MPLHLFVPGVLHSEPSAETRALRDVSEIDDVPRLRRRARPLAAPGAVCLLVIDALLRPDCNANPPRGVLRAKKSQTKRDPKADLPPATRRLNAGAVPGAAPAPSSSPTRTSPSPARATRTRVRPSVPEGPTPVAAARSIRRAARSSSRRMRSRRKRSGPPRVQSRASWGRTRDPPRPSPRRRGLRREGSGVGVGGTRSRGKRPVGTLERNGAFVR